MHLQTGQSDSCRLFGDRWRSNSATRLPCGLFMHKLLGETRHFPGGWPNNCCGRHRAALWLCAWWWWSTCPPPPPPLLPPPPLSLHLKRRLQCTNNHTLPVHKHWHSNHKELQASTNDTHPTEDVDLRVSQSNYSTILPGGRGLRPGRGSSVWRGRRSTQVVDYSVKCFIFQSSTSYNSLHCRQTMQKASCVGFRRARRL